MNIDTSNPQDEVHQDLGTSMTRSATDPYAFQILGKLVDVISTKKTALLILSQIEIVDKLIKLYGLYSSIHNDMFLNKIVGFLNGCEKINQGEKTEFGRRLENDADYRKKVGENLLLILDRLDNFDKTEILGKVFAGRYRGEIDEATFFRLAAAICNASITDLKTLSLSYDKITNKNERLDDATSQSLYSLGFVRAEGLAEIIYHPNELGSNLIRLMKSNIADK